MTESHIHLAARAYPTNPGDPPVQGVNFRASWPSVGSYQTVCSQTSPTHDDVYGCDWQLGNVPSGEVKIGFDVYSSSGVQLAADGVRTLTYVPTEAAAPIPGINIFTGIEPGRLYQPPNYPDKIGINNHDYIDNLKWNELGPTSARAAGTLPRSTALRIARPLPRTTPPRLWN